MKERVYRKSIQDVDDIKQLLKTYCGVVGYCVAVFNKHPQLNCRVSK